MRSFRAHALAAVISVGLATLVPELAYLVGALAAGDLGGPLNLLFIPLLGGACGLAATVLIYLPVGIVLDRVTVRRRWWPAAVGLVCAILLGAALLVIVLSPEQPENGRIDLLLLAASGLSLGFAIHWSVFAAASGSFQREPVLTNDPVRGH